jgi:hypothetical protein
MRSIFVAASWVGIVVVIFVAGCSGKSASPVAATPHHHVHGPHDGELIELGNEEFHAELFDDDERGVVTIYILDKEGKTPVPIAEEAITINMKPGPTVVDFRLPAKPQESDPPGKSSRFESDQKNLKLALQNTEADRELHVKIGENPFVAKFPYYEPEHHHHDDVKP